MGMSGFEINVPADVGTPGCVVIQSPFFSRRVVKSESYWRFGTTYTVPSSRIKKFKKNGTR
jgi:hypothetical protein